MKSYSIYLSTILGLVVATLLWIGRDRIDDFTRYHQTIASESTSSSANEIARFVAEKKRLVAIFADQHRELIGQLARDPENERLYDTLQQQVTLYFPDHFTFTLSDRHGDPLLVDFDGLIGDLCQLDLGAFAETRDQHPRVHPHSDVYHFDVLAPFQQAGDEHILFVSFHADLLGDTLRASQTPGHRLLLVNPDNSDLIEASAGGARNRMLRDDFRLSDRERPRIMHRSKVPGTAWDVIDLHDPELFSDFRHSLLLYSLVILLLFAVISLFTLFLVRRAERLRRKAEAHKDEFLAVISHELRTPLTSIRGSLGLIAAGKAGEVSDKAGRLAAIATRNCERLAALVDDLLDLRKLEAGKFELKLEPVDITELVTQSMNANQGYAEELGVSFVLDHAPGAVRVDADAARLQQVMANLLSNAAKYGRKNDVIEVRIEPGSTTVRVSVTDHGEGVPETFRQHVFDKFAQFDASSVRKVGGTGLGLNIVRHIVELHGGSVGLDSWTGQGSTFYFDLPLTA